MKFYRPNLTKEELIFLADCVAHRIAEQRAGVGRMKRRMASRQAEINLQKCADSNEAFLVRLVSRIA